MLKRILWLSVIAICGWLAWQWFRQRQGEFGDAVPHFAPAHPYRPPARPVADPDEALAPAPPGQPPAAVNAPAAVALDSPEAPPPTVAPNNTGQLFTEAPASAAPAEASIAEEIVGYCMRCRTKRPIKNAHEEISESGRRAARGACPVCGTNMFVFLATGGNERGATP